MRIKSGSFTRADVHRQCNYRAKLAYIDRIPEPDRPLPPGKTEHPHERGTRLHEAAEKFIRGGVELLPELAKFSPEFTKARELFADGKASTEGDWAYTRTWEPTAWMSSDAWCRVKLDFEARPSSKEAIVVDYKSGKRFGNEVKHNEQLQLYVFATLCRYPKVERVTAELWYLDLDDLVSVEYTRAQGLELVKIFEPRLIALTTDEEFKPNPNQYSCKWCPYHPVRGTGHCKVGV